MRRPGPLKTAALGVLAIIIIAVGWAGRPTDDNSGVLSLSFLTAVASGDAEQLESPQAVVVEGSPAAAFLQIAARTVRTLNQAGVAMPTRVSVTKIKGGLQACADDACSRFTRFQLARDGRVFSFVVDGMPVERLVGTDEETDEPVTTTTGGDGSTTTTAPDGSTTSTAPEPETSTTVPGTDDTLPPATGQDPDVTVPVTEAPEPTTTVPPTTAAPTTTAPPPTTAAPTTTAPATTAPRPTTTVPPTTAPPTTAPPTTAAPTTTAPPTTAPPAPSGPTNRDLRKWPFASSSPWNMPVGSSAVFASDGDARTQAIRSASTLSMDKSRSLPLVTWINSTSYSVPVYQASASDPLVAINDPVHGENTQIRIPAGAVPANGTDSNMAILQPDGTTVDVWAAHWTGPTSLQVDRFERTSLSGSGLGPQGGIRASGVSSLGGLIRKWEVDPTDPAYTDGVIRHALAISVSSGMLRYDSGQPGYDANGYGTSLGYVWPATEQDWDAPWTYGGALPMGSLVAIPRSVDITKLGLNGEALAVARALQDYGGYVVDRAGDGTTAFYAEPNVPGGWYASVTGPTWSGQQLTIIRSQLRAVTNNGPSAVGGGGSRPLALAP